jgi:hypothetical protein
MTTLRSDPPGVSRKYPRRPTPRSIEEIRRLLGKAHEKGIEKPELFTCNPQGTEDKKLNFHLETVVEPPLMEIAYDIPGYSYVTALLDKSRQNPINKLGGMIGGDQALRVYWDIAAEAAMLVSAINGSENIGLSLIRVSPFSDEGIIIIGGSELTHNADIEFREAWLMVSQMKDLRNYRYSIEVGNPPHRERFELDLEAFASVLKYPDIVTAATYPVSKPVYVDPEGSGGFIQKEIRELENAEVTFREYLPARYRIDGELAEVSTAFQESLASMGVGSMERGCYVELKFAMEPADALAFLPFTKDGWGTPYGIANSIGTRKGFAEIFSGIGGMRFLNTFFGKAKANRALTPLARAMEDVKSQYNVNVIPVAGSYTQYWVDMPPNAETLECIKRAVRRRIQSDVRDDMGYAGLGFEPHLGMVEARGMRLADLRARLILDSVGKTYAPEDLLDRSDFMLNFLENVDDAVRKRIFSALAHKENGGSPVRISDLARLDMVRRICDEREGGRRTIRDTEDLIWTLRKDTRLPEDIQARKDELEEWWFDFSYERKERVHLLLTREIKAAMDARGG